MQEINSLSQYPCSNNAELCGSLQSFSVYADDYTLECVSVSEVLYV